MTNADTPSPKIRTYTGGMFHPLAPLQSEVRMVDIAHSLSLKCRFTGHTRQFYSVAEHSYRVCDWVKDRAGNSPSLLLQALLHDAAEAYLTDVPQPYKAYLHVGLLPFRNVEDRVLHAVFDHFEIPHDYDLENLRLALPEIVHKADQCLYLTELRDLMQGRDRDTAGADGHKIMPWPAAIAERCFMARFTALWSKLRAQQQRNTKIVD